MDKLVAILGILSALLMLASTFLEARSLPDKSIVEGFKGKKSWEQGEINGIGFTLAFLINDKQLALKSNWPSIGLISNISNLETFKVKSFCRLSWRNSFFRSLYRPYV